MSFKGTGIKKGHLDSDLIAQIVMKKLITL